MRKTGFATIGTSKITEKFLQAAKEYHRDSPPVNNFFHFSAIYCNYAKRPRYRSLSIIALTDYTSVRSLQWPARRYNRRPDEIRYSPRPS